MWTTVRGSVSQLVALWLVFLPISLCNNSAAATGAQIDTPGGPPVAPFSPQGAGALLADEFLGVAYSGFRRGQHPDRGSGAVNPSRAEIDEDLELLDASGFRLIRLYDSGPNSEQVLARIRAKNMPLRVVLGAWLKAEESNHEGCPWLSEPIPDQQLAANRLHNREEIQRVIKLAAKYPQIVTAANVNQ